MAFDEAPLTVYGVAADLLECARAELAGTAAGAPERRCVVPGGAASFEDCCAGQLTVHARRTFASSSFPNEDRAVQPCFAGLVAVEYVVTILRCAPTGKGPKPPTCEQLDASARTTMADAAAVRRGVACCLHENRQKVVAVLGAQPFVAPQGGCVGSELSVTVGLFDGCPCQ